jgi:hypothetical protein
MSSADCIAQGNDAGISAERAAILFAMSRSWIILAVQTEKYDALEKQECAARRQL